MNEAPGLGVDINEKEAAKYPINNKAPGWTVRKNDGTIINDESKEADKLRNTAKNQVVLASRGNIDKWIIHDSLNNYERYLRNILRLRGMDMPKKTDPGHSLLNQ